LANRLQPVAHVHFQANTFHIRAQGFDAALEFVGDFLVNETRGKKVEHLLLTGIVRWPASYHGNTAGYGFADGHSEIHRFRDNRTMPPIVQGGLIPLNQNLPGDQDVKWMAQKAAGLMQYPY
jgi:prepilin-type processing-associated H-X9-DG protein